MPLKYIFTFAALTWGVLFHSACQTEKEPSAWEKFVQQPAQTISFQDLSQLYQEKGEHIYIVNFWATWCAPCVEELPDLDSLHTTYGSRGVRVILVSVDFPDELGSIVQPFLDKHQVQAPVRIIEDTNANEWIDAVSPEWSGAIPGTLVLDGRTGARHFIEGQTSFEHLEYLIKHQLEFNI